MLKAIGELPVGTSFNEIDDRPGVKPTTIRDKQACKTDHANVHVFTGRGDWCISKLQNVRVN